jgi:methylmalonyl-CoA/ethylmalonyl-CoA epimerase
MAPPMWNNGSNRHFFLSLFCTMLTNIEHIGIAVKNMEEANILYTSLLNRAPYKEEAVASENVITSFFRINQTKIELLQATSPVSAIANFIDKKGEGIHHIAFETDDLDEELKRLAADGFQVLPGFPKPGADNKMVAFLHPKGTTGVLVELCMEIKA